MTTSNESRLSLEETRHVAKLARLEFDEEDLKEIHRDLERTLDTVAQMESVPVEGLEATLAVGAYANRYREDEIGPTLDRESALANAPRRRDGHFEITRIISKLS